ncbi:MAG TPA: hypothetical protein VEG60_15375, partial [Candidatus Binatia bacterium]|nr:hypothetical protein [Candidatus Binatia bacterium]
MGRIEMMVFPACNTLHFWLCCALTSVKIVATKLNTLLILLEGLFAAERCSIHPAIIFSKSVNIRQQPRPSRRIIVQ